MKRLTPMIAALALAALVLPGAWLAFSPTPANADPDLTTRQWFEKMDARYRSLETAPSSQTRGTGFKPYHRYRWFAEPRLDPVTGNQTPGCRWEAWKQMQAMEEKLGTRSDTWFSLGPINVAGRCLAIEVHPTDPNIVYAGFASGGIWKTTDKGTTWVPLGDFLPTLAVTSIEIDPNDTNRMWIGTGEGWNNIDAVHGVGVMVSTDAGVNWALTGYNYTMSQMRDVFELEYNPVTGTLMIGADNGLWRSTDGGVSFSQLYVGSWGDVELKPGSSSTMYATKYGATDPGFHISTDDGATWTLCTVGVPTSDIDNNRFAVTPADTNYIYWGVAKADGTMNGIWKSTNGGLTFQYVFGGDHYGTQGWYDVTLDVDRVNKEKVFSGGIYFYKSVNGGSNFARYSDNVHVDHHAIAWAPSDPTNLWLGSDGGVWRSTDSGATFVDVNTGLATMQFYAVNHAASLVTRAMGGTQDNGTYLYNNDLNWSYALGGDGFFTEIDRTNPNTLYGELYYGDHRRSTDGGANFSTINGGIGEQGPWSTPTHMDFGDPYILWTAHTSKIYRSTNRGTTWTVMNPTMVGFGFGGGRSIHQCAAHPEVLAVLSSQNVWITTDSGATWENRETGMTAGSVLADVAVHPTDPNIMVVTCATYASSTYRQVWKTTNQGANWTAIDTQLPNEPANSIEIDPQHPDWYFVGTDLGVYVSFDAGANWQPFNTGLPHVVVADLRIHNLGRLLRAGTHGRGMWEVDISGLDPGATEEARPTVQPLTLRVFGNPASDRTTLRYGMRTPGQVRLGLFDAQGRQVQELVNRFEYPIVGTVDVNLQDLPNGVYFARLEANGAQISQKVVVER